MKTYTKIHNFRHPSLLPLWMTRNNHLLWLVVSAAVTGILAFFIVLVSIYLDIPFSQVSISDYKLNEVAPYDFVVTRDISYVNVKATLAAREEASRKVLPIFELNSDISNIVDGKFRLLVQILSGSALKNIPADKVLKEIIANLPQAAGMLGKNDVAALLALFPNHTEVIETTDTYLDEVMSIGIFHRLDEMVRDNPEIFTEEKIDFFRGPNIHEEIPLNKALSMGNLQDYIENRTKKLPYNEVNKSLVILLVTSFAMENSFYNRIKTEENRKKAREDVKPVMVNIARNYVIVRKGDIVTEDALEKIHAHGESDISLNINTIIGAALIIVLAFSLSITLLSRNMIFLRLKRNRLLLLEGIGLVYLIMIAILSKIPNDSLWLPFSIWVPSCTIAIIISLLIAPNVGLVFSLIISVVFLLVTRMDVNAFVYSLLMAVAGCIASVKIRKRFDIILTGLFLSACSFVVLVTIGFINNVNMNEILIALGWSFFNGFVFGGILSSGSLTMFEHLLNAATRFRLLELSDLNAPIFKRMLNYAPGTYNHSIIMANLAETACTEIGANALLARVGAYYHDIGKLDQPEYFIENQTNDNIHDDLKPSLSVAVIKSHVKLGIEKAKEMKLPQEVIDIIAQHHGKGLISYFYHRALDDNRNEKISPDDFKYPGERPKSKEAAVVMLADIVEAASRTIKKPQIKKFEKLIWRIIMEKFTSGDLSECALTLNELEIIKKSFITILAGHFHSRIEYPKLKENA